MDYEEDSEIIVKKFYVVVNESRMKFAMKSDFVK
jgi:hypothetical protein